MKSDFEIACVLSTIERDLRLDEETKIFGSYFINRINIDPVQTFRGLARHKYNGVYRSEFFVKKWIDALINAGYVRKKVSKMITHYFIRK